MAGSTEAVNDGGTIGRYRASGRAVLHRDRLELHSDFETQVMSAGCSRRVKEKAINSNAVGRWGETTLTVIVLGGPRPTEPWNKTLFRHLCRFKMLKVERK
jgi:hypothetical protein